MSKVDISDETRLLYDIIDLWNKFISLPRQHPDELLEFKAHLHAIQSLIGMRILRKEHPEIFPTYKTQRKTPCK